MESSIRVKHEQQAATNLQQTDVKMELRDLRPAHFIFKINNFSSLPSENYESTDFSVGGYNWKLRVHPKGNKKVNENKHISLYLVLSNSLSLLDEVNVYLKLFVYNQIQDMYLTIQDAKWRIRRFRGMKTEWGFDQVLPINFLNDASNGYLIDDCCIFGAEVFVLRPTTKECSVNYLNSNSYTPSLQNYAAKLDSGSCKLESVTVVKDLIGNNTYTWKVKNFGFCESSFSIGGHQWTLKLNSQQSVFSIHSHLKTMKRHEKLFCEFILRVRNQLHGKDYEQKGKFLFYNSEGYGSFYNFKPLHNLSDTVEGYIVDDCVIVELEIPIMTMSHYEF